MMRGNAPAGYYTSVEIWVSLNNGTAREYGWSTPMAINPALHKALAWAKANMRKEGVRGRTKICRVDLAVRYVAGRYRK